MDQVYRIGSFLAVFWESNNPQRMLVWHRFNRRGNVGQFMPHAPLFVFAASIGAAVIALLLISVYKDNMFLSDTPNIKVMLIGSFEFIPLFFIFVILRNRRIFFEKAWVKLKKDVQRQKEIHEVYGDAEAR